MGKKILLNWTRLLMLVMTIGLSGMISQESWGQEAYEPKITSDKDDYLPGEIATISGSGWTQDQTVELHIEEDPYFGDAYFFESIPVDENGNWSVQIEILERHLGVAFTAYAIGHSTGATAFTYFTDGNITFSTTGLPSGISVAVNWSHTQGQGQSGTMTFNSPGPSASLGINNQTFSYSFPVNLSLNGSIYTLSSSSPSSGFNTGAGNVSIIVNAVYELFCSPALISTQPSNQSITYGNGASFSVVYSGVGTKTLQWQVNTGSGFTNISNGDIYSGVNSETLTVSNPTVAMSGYQYRVIISGGCGTPVTSNPASLTVNKKEISGNFTADDKVYDGNTSATVLTRTLNGVISPDAVTLIGGTATFNDANAGIGKTVTLTGASLSGADVGNYTLTAVNNTTANIDKAPTVTTVTINGGPFTYTGSEITPATVTVTGAGGLNLTPAASYANNINAGTATASYSYEESANHLASSDSKNFTIGKADATIVVTGKTVTYDGTAHGATGTAKGVMGEDLAGLDLGATFTNVPGGTANWTFTDVTGNYNNASGSVDIVINKAPTVTTVTINGGPFTYTGSAITPATVTVTGAGGLNLTPAASYANNINAGTATASYSYEESANHLASSDSKNFTIGKADATIVVQGKTVTYDGTAHGATGTAKGVMGEDLAGLDLGASFTNFPGGTADWTFTDVTGNYNNASGSVDIVINKAPTVTTVTINGGPFTYTGSAITPATVTVTGAGGLNLTPAASYANNINAGTATASYSYEESANHLASSDSKNFTIGKADATIVVQGKTVTYDGTAHGATGTAKGVMGEDLAGLDLGATFTNVPGGTANWTFTDVTGNYNNASGSVDIVINKAPTVTTVTINGGPFTYTGSAITPATVTVTGAGGLNLTPAASYANNINAGTATASYSYEESANHLASSDSKNFTIGKADATIVVTGKTVTYDGTAHGATGTAKGVMGEDLAGLDLGATFTNVPGGTANWTFTDVTGNYNNASGSVDIVINKRAASVSANSASKFCGQADPIFGGTLEGFIESDNVTAVYSRTSGETVGLLYIISAVLSPVAVLSNYDITYNTANFTINGITIDASASSTPVPMGSPATLRASVTPNVAGVSVTFTVTNEANATVYTTTVLTNGSGIATATTGNLSTIGVLKVTAVAGTGCAESVAYIPVFDASGSFVTGGGWIESPAGAMPANQDAVGKANFGFVSRYKKGSTQVDGNTEFQFNAGGLNFKSTLHESGSLVISGSRATYRGTGTVNGASGFRFMVVAIDGQWNGGTNPDRFRIKITDSNGQVVYDNQIGKDENTADATVLGNNGTGGGSIVIHQASKGNKRVITELVTVPWNTPVETIKQKVDQMSLTWFESRKLPMTLDASNYDPLTPGFYELKADLIDNEFFALDEPISIQVLVQDKPKALDILVDNSKLTTDLKAGDVLGTLRTIDPVDNIHTYGIGDHPDLTLDGDKVIWKGTTVPAQLRLTVFSTDRAGQTISREISLSRELKPGEFFLYPNPAQRETNVMVDLDREATVTIRIYDAVGRMVLENESFREGNFTQTFNLDGLAAGFYTVQVKVGDMVMTKRLIKR